MIGSRPRTSRRLRPILLLAAILAGTAVKTAPVQARDLTSAEEAGAWDLSFEAGNRRCRLTLRPEAGPSGLLLAMPAGCHRAFPLLATVATWAPAANDHIVFQSEAGRPVLDFVPGGGPALSTRVGESADLYLLTPVSSALQDALVEQAQQPPEAAVPPAKGAAAAAAEDGVLVDSSTPASGPTATAASMLPPPTTAEVAGHYAVVRQNRDTGCMVTLEDSGASHADLKARLAPACRDQGIVIFDPVGWQLSKGQLLLTAKKGHKAILTRRQDRTWATAPSKGTPLVLKRL